MTDTENSDLRPTGTVGPFECFHLLDQSVVVCDELSHVRFLNDAAEAFYGRVACAVIGKPAADLIRVLRSEVSRAEIDAAVERHGAWHGRAVHLVKDERQVWVEWTVKRLTLPEEGGVGTVELIRDISERISTEETLRRSDEKHRAYIAHAPGAFFVADRESRYREVNPAACRMLGYTEDELLALSIGDLLPKGTGLDAFEDLKRTSKRSGETLLVRKDGSTLPVSVESAALPDGRFMAFCTDVSERHQLEDSIRASDQKIRDILDNTRIHMWAFDGNIYSYINSEWYAFTGQDPALPLTAERWIEMVHPDDLEEAGAIWTENLANRTEHDNYFRLRRWDGVYRDFFCHAVPVLDDLGEFVHFQGFNFDITLRKQAEKENDLLAEQLHQAQKMEAVGRLAGGVAHDFNNVLGVIIGNVDMALVDLSDRDPLRESLDEINEAADRATVLTRQLLTFSRKQVIDPKVINLSAVIKNLHSMLSRLIGEQVILRTAPQERLGLVRLDPGQIEQIVLNLAINARDAMPDGGELIIETADVMLDEDYCASHAGARPGAHVMLTVSDTGSGISAEIRKKIFEPFFTTKQLGQGTGLGLSTVFGIVEQSGGRIEVSSEPGQGTSFEIYFPAVFDEAESDLKMVAPALSGGSATVLVVEDEDRVRKMAVGLLTSLGYEVLATGSGSDAIAVAKRHDGPIDLLLTDVVMPHMNGRELAERICELRPGIGVLYTSGYTQDVIAHHGVLDEGIHFIAKPYSRNSLAARVRQVLDT